MLKNSLILVLLMSWASASVADRVATTGQVLSIARLYSAAFDRQPKADGLNFWVRSFERGEGIQSIASRFYSSPEFIQRFGTPNNQAYVEQLFINILGRRGAPDGIAFWTRQLDTRSASRAALLVSFANTPENKQKTSNYRLFKSAENLWVLRTVGGPATSGLNATNAGRAAGFQVELIELAKEMVSEWGDDSGAGRFDSRIPDGDSTRPCTGDGTVRIELAQNRSFLEERFSGCKATISGSEVTLNGRASTVLVPSQESIVRQFFDFAVTLGDLTEIYNGEIRVNNAKKVVVANLQIKSSVEGEIRAENWLLGYADWFDFANSGRGINRASGIIRRSGIGAIEVTKESSGMLLKTGNGASVELLHDIDNFFGINYFIAYYFESGREESDQALSIATNDLSAYRFFDDSVLYSPTLMTSEANNIGKDDLLQRESTVLNVVRHFTDYGGDLLQFDAKVIAVMREPLGSATEPVEIPLDDPSVSYTLSPVSAGRWSFSSDTTGPKLRYQIAFKAVDADGLVSAESLIVDVIVTGDFDGDGIPDIEDQDIDNDGTPRFSDDFPYDPNEQNDSDGDGIGDSADLDTDNDGVNDSVDAYPLDPVCSRPDEGNGENCYSTLGDQTVFGVAGAGGLVYLFRQDAAELARYDIATQQYLTPIEFSTESSEAAINTIISYNEGRSLAVLFWDGELQVLDVRLEVPRLVYRELAPTGAIGVSIKLSDGFLVKEDVYSEAPRYRIKIIDTSGTVLASLNSELYSFRGPAYEPYEPFGVTIRYVNGSPRLVEFENQDPLISDGRRLSPDGKFYLGSDSEVRDGATNNLLFYLYEDVKDLTYLWNENNGLAVLVRLSDRIQLDQYDSEFNLIRSQRIAGRDAFIFSTMRSGGPLWRSGNTLYFITGDRIIINGERRSRLVFGSLPVGR
ncbi:MAG: DUF4214 domain-containing protein, partial [Pseudomonadota bacterium]